MLRTVALDHLRILAISGAERAAFLQGQLTQDVASARTDATILAGWADAKGRLLFAGHLFATHLATGDALALLVPAETAPDLLKRLRMYILRAKAEATLLDIPVTGLVGELTGPATTQPIRLFGAGIRHLCLGIYDATGESVERGTRDDWQLDDIRAGLPTIVAATTGEFVPQMVNLDLQDGISFTKGCYTGQEIVARMKYRGRVKRRMLRFATAAEPPAAGTSLHAERGTVGQVVLSSRAESGSEFLAVVVLDDLPGPLYLDEGRSQAVRQLDLPYDVPL
ncbi:MAG: hypothetical protein ABIX37_09415 [Gammaproteobacteria bacterium]